MLAYVIAKILPSLILALSITRGELAPNQRYTVTGSVYNASSATAQLVAPQGIVVIDTNPVIINQASPDPVTLHWLIEVTPAAQRNIALPLTLTVNQQSYTIPIRVDGYSTYLPIVDRRGSS